jgi:hypothetical protein
MLDTMYLRTISCLQNTLIYIIIDDLDFFYKWTVTYLVIRKNMGAAIIDFRVCPPLVKCQNIMFSGFIDRPFSTGQLSAFIIQLVTWQVLPRSERKNKISCNKNAIKNTEMLENYIYCILAYCFRSYSQSCHLETHILHFSLLTMYKVYFQQSFYFIYLLPCFNFPAYKTFSPVDILIDPTTLRC